MNFLQRALVKLPLVALVFGLPFAAGAQPAQEAPAATTTSLASPGGGARNELTFTLNTRYEDNVPRLNDLQPNTRNLVRSDVKVSPALQLDFARAIGRHQVGVKSYLGYDFFAQNTILNRERIIVEPFAYLDLPVCDLTVQGLARRQQSDLGELAIVGFDPTIGSDNTETRKQINARAVCGERYGLRPNFEFERGSGDNSNPFRRIADFEVTRYQTGVGYATPTLGEIGIYAFKQDTDLPNQLLPDGLVSGYTQRGFGLSYARAIGTRLRFNGSVSHVDVTPYNGQGSQSGLNANVAVTLIASQRLQLVALANRSFTSSLSSNATYELAQGYGLTANYAVNDRLRLRAGGQVSPRSFFYVIQPTGPFIGRQTQYDIFAGASYQLNPRLRLTVDTGAQRRDADLDFFDYRSFYAAFGIAVSL